MHSTTLGGSPAVFAKGAEKRSQNPSFLGSTLHNFNQKFNKSKFETGLRESMTVLGSGQPNPDDGNNNDLPDVEKSMIIQEVQI